MKRYAIVGAVCMIGLSAALTGCLTSVKSEWEQGADGVIRARVSVLSSGTQSEALAKGFDAGPQGSILEDASGKQDSTSAVEAFRDIAVTYAPLVNALVAGPAAAKPAPSLAAGEARAVPEETARVPAVSAELEAAPQTFAGTNAAVTVAILGDRSACTLCRALWGEMDAPALSAGLCGARVVDADRSADPAAYALFRPGGVFNYPLVRVFGNGILAGEFSARGMTREKIAARVREIAPSCAATP